MVPSTAQELAESIRRSDLLARAQVIKMLAMLPSLSGDPQELAYALVQRGWLTHYQAEQALAGKAEHLCLGGFVLLTPIGVGGMGQVFKAWQKRLSRFVALKVIREDLLASNPGVIRRFSREAKAVANLQHPNIVGVIDLDQANGTYFFVMEYVDGIDLERLVQEHGPLPVPLACDYIRQAALGLQHAHDKLHLVHRDIKPSNLLVSWPQSARRDGADAGPGRSGSFAHGLVKVLDMGLARSDLMQETKVSMTREGAMMGTPDYVAPEQARDASSADIRADLYSLGCTLFYLLTGQPPFPEGTMMERLLKHQHDPPPPLESLRPDVPPMVRAVVRKLLAKDPRQRFQLPIELVEALSEILHLPPTPAAPAAGPAPPLPPLAPTPPILDRALTPPVPTPSPLAPDRPPAGVPAPPTVPAVPTVAVVTAVALQQRDADPDGYRPDQPVLPAKKLWMLKSHVGAVMALAFSADGRLLATGGLDQTVRLWSLPQDAPLPGSKHGALDAAPPRVPDPTPREVASLVEPTLGDVSTLAFSPAADLLATGSASINAHPWLWSWRLTAGRDRQAVDGPPGSECVVFSPDGETLVSAAGPALLTWTVADGAARKRTQVRSMSGPDFRVALFSPDGRWLVGGDAGGEVHFWKPSGWSGRPGASLRAHKSGVSSMVYSADGTLLATAGLDHRVCVWDGIGSGAREKAILSKIRGVVRRMLFLPDPQYLLTAGDGGQVILWNWPKREPQHEWKLDQKLITSLAIAPDGTCAAGNSDGHVALFDLVPD